MSELLYGRHAVLEALRAKRRRVYRLWTESRGGASPATGNLAEILEIVTARALPLQQLQGGLFDRMRSENNNAQGVALEVDPYPYADVNICLRAARDQGEPPLLLILDHLQDPQNLGTLMRTAEAMGVHGIVIPDRRAAGITPAVSNASAGAVEHMLVAKVTNINRVIDQLKADNIWIAGLDNVPEAPLLAQARLDGALAIVVGSEAEGLSHLTREKCDFLVRLPMVGRVESLNAAVAGSIVLYAAREARSK